MIRTDNNLVNKMFEMIEQTNTDIAIYNNTTNEQLKAKTLKAIEYNRNIIRNLSLLINNEQIEYTILSI